MAGSSTGAVQQEPDGRSLTAGLSRPADDSRSPPKSDRPARVRSQQSASAQDAVTPEGPPMNTTVTTHTLNVLGTSIYYEFRGSGPLLAMIGAPMGASGFSRLADLMASEHTVLTYDPRGSEHSTVTDRTEATTPELLADDVHRVLAAVSGEPVSILGSSGGAVTGLALVTAHPEQVSLLVAHEPPVFTLLSNADDELSVIDAIQGTYLRAGSDAAMRQFLLSIGVLGEEGSRQFAASPEPEPVPARRYVPWMASITDSSS